MLSAVHTDRSGRVFVSGDYFAAGFDGRSTVPLAETVALPEGTRLVPMERDALGFDRAGRARLLARGRWTLGAVLAAGHVRTLHPAFDDVPAESLAALPYAAVGAGESGALRVAAIAVARPADAAPADLDARVRDALRARPSNRLARQLARCARDFDCVAARDAFAGRRTAPITVAAPDASGAGGAVATRWRADETPTERAAFRPSAAEIAEVATAHLRAGGEAVSFGRGCEGEPTGALRLLEDAIRRIRAETDAEIDVETEGGSATALRRLAAAGLSAVTVRIASARSETYEALHAPTGHRWADVRVSLHAAAELRLAIRIALLAFPGITDRPSEVDELVGLLRELPGAVLLPRDLAGDPLRTLALVRSREEPMGIAAALQRIGREAPGALGAGKTVA